jgi:hypothetical protein
MQGWLAVPYFWGAMLSVLSLLRGLVVNIRDCVVDANFISGVKI